MGVDGESAAGGDEPAPDGVGGGVVVAGELAAEQVVGGVGPHGQGGVEVDVECGRGGQQGVGSPAPTSTSAPPTAKPTSTSSAASSATSPARSTPSSPTTSPPQHSNEPLNTYRSFFGLFRPGCGSCRMSPESEVSYPLPLDHGPVKQRRRRRFQPRWSAGRREAVWTVLALALS